MFDSCRGHHSFLTAPHPTGRAVSVTDRASGEPMRHPVFRETDGPTYAPHSGRSPGRARGAADRSDDCGGPARSSTELDAAVLEDGRALRVQRLEAEGAPSIRQTLVVTDSPGNSGAEKRTAIRVTARGSSMPAASRTARPANAIVQSPCTIRPGSPTCRANSSSRWIAKSSPEAAAYRTVWSSATGYVTSASGGSPSTSSRWSGARSPTPSVGRDSAEELRDVLLVHELAVLSRVSVLITSDVPFGRARSATGVARERSIAPGAMGRCSTMSCS